MFGSGVNRTLMAYGDAMLRNGGKKSRPDLFKTGSLSYSTGFERKIYEESFWLNLSFFLCEETERITITTLCPTKYSFLFHFAVFFFVFLIEI